MRVEIKEVNQRQEARLFSQFGNMLYADNPYYVPDMESDIMNMVNHRHNDSEAETIPFLAFRGDKVAGRILGIINHKANRKWNVKVVRFGFLDFIDDEEVSQALIAAVERWGKAHGMESIQGPMGLTDFDKEGMLLEDFDKLGSMSTLYNAPYYPKHLEKMGFRKQVDWIQIRVNVPDEVPERIARVASIVEQRFKVHIHVMTTFEILTGWGKRVFQLLNEAYAPLFGFSAIEGKEMDSFIRTYLPIVDKSMVPVIVNEDNEIVGVAVTIGSLSRALQKTKGKLFPLGLWHLLKSLKLKNEEGIDMLLIGVRPDMQGIGINSLFFNHLIPIYKKKHFKWAETGPQLEDNHKELSQWKNLNPQYIKRRRCYTKDIL
jgi:hypothetical protein